MHTRHKGKVILCWLLVGVGFSSCCNYNTCSDEWGVLVVGLPESLSITRARGNTTYYILKQTHEPVFRKDDGQNYTSRILNKWARNINYSQYDFCPKTSLCFNRANSFTFDFFVAHIRTITAQFDPDFSLALKEGCLTVGFKKSKVGYLDFLTAYENAPSIKQSENIEVGLGPFYVKSITNDRIILERKTGVRNGYNKIVLYEYQGDTDPNLENRAIKDFNLIPDFDVPQWVIDEYAVFTNIELKTVALIINHPDSRVREFLYNCIDGSQLRAAFYPKKHYFYNVQTILPLGIAGAKAGETVQQCGGTLSSKGYPPIVFANWMHGNDVQMKKFADDFIKKTGVKITIANFPPKKLVKVFNKYPRPYNLVIIVFDAVRANTTAFFESFTKSNGFHDFEMPGIKQIYDIMVCEDNEAKKKEIAVQIADKLAKEAVVLPLYQSVRELYYPQKIKNINIGKGFLEYPEVAEFRW